MSKLFERLAASQLIGYLETADLLPSLQSGFRPRHSAETAVLHVLSDILAAVDRGDVAALALLDLSAAFDTVDHDILVQRLQTSYGIKGNALQWFRSYLHGRQQSVRRGSKSSKPVTVICGVPQGSVLGPILFVLYTADIAALVQRSGLVPHLYADDTQVYGWSPPHLTGDLLEKFSACFDNIYSWMRANRLQLNMDKTEFMWCTTTRRQHQLPAAEVTVGPHQVTPSKSVRDLGIFLDSDLVMRTHVLRTVSRCFAMLRQLRSIRRSVPTSTLQTLVVSLVLSRLDYGNATLVGLPIHLQRRMQSVLNASARLILDLRRSDHITDALASLHWLRVSERIKYKTALLAFRALRGEAPRYLSDDLVRVADVSARRRLRSSATTQLMVPAHRLSTIGSRSFPVAAPTLWNQLPTNVTSASSLPEFHRKLKTHLFKASFPNIV